jgi:hypothetical protein
MYINIIDYRGDNKVINSRGDILFDYRTKYFLQIQQDFDIWKKNGHRFRCFTQHHTDTHFDGFDEVINIPQGNAAQSRNHVLNYYPISEWISIWDNDATLYFDKLESRRFVSEVDLVCQLAEQQDILSFVPFNAQQAPYPQNPKPAWTFKPKLEQKGTMLFLKTGDWRFDEKMTALEDLEYACRLSLQGKKFAQCEQVSLKECVHGKSTIFEINAYHRNYNKLGSNANPKGLLKWDAQLDRTEKYKTNIAYIEQKLGLTLKQLRDTHKKIWNNTNNTYHKLFKTP